MRILSYFSIRLPFYLTYMIQQVEYEPAKFIDWLKRIPNLRLIMHRQQLVLTSKAKALVSFQYLFNILCLVFIGIISADNIYSLGLIVLIPIVDIFSLIIAVELGRIVSWPLKLKQIRNSRTIFNEHPGLKIAILGSYGKTTMKELLSTVLSEGINLRATPGNKNVPISHARWAKTLSGNEDVLLIEYGESKPGDIKMFYNNTKPDKAILTGIAPNHLDKYTTIDALKKDLVSIIGLVGKKSVYINGEDKIIGSDKKLAAENYNLFNDKGVAGIRLSDIKIGLEGMSFSANLSDKKNIHLKTALVGRHLLGPLAVCIKLADEIGLDARQIKSGIEKTKPFEHRMQPRNVGGAWIIDDTYNGSLEGFRAGLELLKELKSKRKIYVTPGLVDQGEETQNVHEEIGRLIARCNPDKVVLISNSVTTYIEQSLKASAYKGEIEICNDALAFYNSLEHTLASGDIALLQNDWTDNYY